MIGGVLAVALAACQTSEGRRVALVAEPGWRVVERTGEARFQHPDGNGWAPVMAGGEIAAASRVATGAGGRVIVAGPGVQIAAGTAASFVLADPGARPVRQEAGRLRYRVERAAGEPFVLETAFMRIKTPGAVFDVAIGPDGGEVVVETGRLLVTTPDGTRGATLEAGQTAYAGARQGARLMVRRGADEPAMAIQPDLVSVEPRRATAAVHAMARATLARGPAAATDAAQDAATAADRAVKPAIVAAGYREEAAPADRQGLRTPVPAAKPTDGAGLAALEPPAAVVDERQAGFDRLTAGLLESLAGAAPASKPRRARGPRSL